jgi:hypothetical protein
MKISINLTDKTHDLLGELVKRDDANASVVCEAAIVAFGAIDPAVRSKLIRETLAAKRPQTPSSWRALFWTALAEQFDKKDMAAGNPQYLMAARPYCGFQVIFDAQHGLTGGDPQEIIVFTDTAPPYTETTRRIGETWTFRVGESVFDAARKVAGWLRDHEAELAR